MPDKKALKYAEQAEDPAVATEAHPDEASNETDESLDAMLQVVEGLNSDLDDDDVDETVSVTSESDAEENTEVTSDVESEDQETINVDEALAALTADIDDVAYAIDEKLVDRDIDVELVEEEIDDGDDAVDIDHATDAVEEDVPEATADISAEIDEDLASAVEEVDKLVDQAAALSSNEEPAATEPVEDELVAEPVDQRASDPVEPEAQAAVQEDVEESETVGTAEDEFQTDEDVSATPEPEQETALADQPVESVPAEENDLPVEEPEEICEAVDTDDADNWPENDVSRLKETDIQPAEQEAASQTPTGAEQQLNEEQESPQVIDEQLESVMAGEVEEGSEVMEITEPSPQYPTDDATVSEQSVEIADEVEVEVEVETEVEPEDRVAEAAPVVEKQRVKPIEEAKFRGRYAKTIIAHHNRGSTTTEKYRALRTSLLAQTEDERFSYMVTSPDYGEGKTVTCLNLAVVLAERVDRRTLVVDCDLRRHGVASLLGINESPGMAEVLTGRAELDDVIQPTASPNMFAISAGTLHDSQACELLEGADLKAIFEKLRAEFDYVIADTPPINMVSDAGIVGRAVGQSLLVVKTKSTHRKSIENAMGLLNTINVRLGGIVLTHYKPQLPGFLARHL